MDETPVYIRLKDGRLIQNGILADYPGRPVPKSPDRIMRFDMLRRRLTFHQQIQSLTAAIENDFSKEWKRQTRVYLRLHYGLSADPLDEFPIN